MSFFKRKEDNYYPKESFDLLCETNEIENPESVWYSLVCNYEVGKIDGKERQNWIWLGTIVGTLGIGYILGCIALKKKEKQEKKKELEDYLKDLDTELENLED